MINLLHQHLVDHNYALDCLTRAKSNLNYGAKNIQPADIKFMFLIFIFDPTPNLTLQH